MLEPRAAKLIELGGSQAVLLPADSRFGADEVFRTREAITEAVTLSMQQGAAAWARLLAIAGSFGDAPHFIRDRPMNLVAIDRRSFDDEGWHPPDPLDRMPHGIAK